MIFHRSPRQTQTVLRLQPAAGLCSQALGILDILRLIQCHDMPLLRLHDICVPHQQRIARHDQIILLQMLKVTLARLSLHQQQTQRRREFDRFIDPIPQHARRCHNQAGLLHASAFLLNEDMRQRLQRLAQPHVIRQDAMQAKLAQELHPRRTFALIVAQTGLKPRWR